MQVNAQHVIDAQARQIAELSHRLAVAEAQVTELTQDVPEDGKPEDPAKQKQKQ